MNIDKIMSTTPETLATVQYNALLDHVINRLREVATNLKEAEYDKVRDMLYKSPAGDGYGEDNMYIDFGWNSAHYDIAEITSMLERLYQQKGESE